MGTAKQKQFTVTEKPGSTTIESFLPSSQDEILQREAERNNKALADSSKRIFKLKLEIFDLTKKIDKSDQAIERKEKRAELKKELEENMLMVMEMGGFEKTCAAIGFDVKKAVENNKKDVKEAKKQITHACTMRDIEFVPTVESKKK